MSTSNTDTAIDTLVNDATKDIVARMDKLKADLKVKPEQPLPTPIPPEPTPIPPQPQPPIQGVDRFGIKKIYPDAAAPKEWCVNMDDPAKTANFKNLPTITKQPDGSFQTSATQVRMEAWSPPDKKWQNVEITAYQKHLSGANQYGYVAQMYRGGGHHSENNVVETCWGAAYKTAVLEKSPGVVTTQCRKEVNHPAYCKDRADTQTSTKTLLNRWIGMKQITYNYIKDGKTFVRMEVWIDDDVTDASGNLAIKNNWKLYSNTNDTGGWITNATNFTPNCPPLNKDSTQPYRQRDEILNMPGMASAAGPNQNLCAWRSDNVKLNWKFLSVREISAPATVV